VDTAQAASRLRSLASGAARRSRTAVLREVLPEIETAVRAGVSQVVILEELRTLGHGFRTTSDTEVLLAAYAQWGPEALPRFNGMWAFAIYDARRGEVFCSRDRFGVKPFHYFWDGSLFAFASEIKGLLAHPRVTAKPRAAASRWCSMVSR